MDSSWPLLGPSISSLTPLGFLEHIRSLRIEKETKGSRSVPGITLTWLEKRKAIRIDREQKTLLLSEVEALATEHGIDLAELVTMLSKTKKRIEDSNGLWINQPPAKRSKEPKANAKPRRARKLQDKLLKLEPDPELPTQDTIQPSIEPA